jgi:Tfp pilus assembly protein PilZ
MYRINRRVVWATCGGVALVAASTLATLALLSKGWSALSDPETGSIQLGMAALTFAGLSTGTFAGTSAVAFTSIWLIGLATERRRIPERREVSMDVALVTEGGSSIALSKNISTSGMFVKTDRAYTVGERLKLKFRLAGQESRFSIEAEVRWVRRDSLPGVGLLFIDPPGSLKDAIHRFLATGRRQRLLSGLGLS